MNKLKIGDILIATDTIITNNYRFYKNNKYKIIDNLPNFIVESYSIISEKGNHYALSEIFILQNFNCVRYDRKEKLEKLNNKYEL